MIHSLLLLSASMVSTPVFISEVKAVREAGHLRVEVRGDGGIDPEGARTSIDDGRLFLYLGGTHVRADNRAWQLQDGTGEIRAHRHHSETELVVPLEGNGCAGPVELAGSPTGITALVGCEGAVSRSSRRSDAERETKAVSDTRSEKTTREVTRETAGQSAGDNRKRDKELAALIALPPVDDKATARSPAGFARPDHGASDLKPAPTPTPPSTSTSAAGGAAGTAVAANRAATVLPRVESATAIAGDSPKAPPAPATTTAATTTAATVTAATATSGSAPASATAPASTSPSTTSATSAKLSIGAASFGAGSQTRDGAATTPVAPMAASSSSGGLRTVLMPALFLAALAAAAFAFARRRRTPMDRRIHILETASLGPKRSLVVARIGGETLILGTSEAGITLLKASVSAPEMPAMAVVAPTAEPGVGAAVGPMLDEITDLSQPIDEALADIPEPGDTRPLSDVLPAVNRTTFRALDGGLADLFGGRPGAATGRGRQDPAPGDDFGEILEDSVEDQELRQKLAAGLSARVR